MKVKIVVPVWGDNYIETFLNLSLPSQMCADGIPTLAQENVVSFVIYTTSDGLRKISTSPIIQKLASLVQVTYVLISSKPVADPYRIFSKAYAAEINKSSKINECVYLLNADIITSCEFYRETLNKIKLGYKAVNVTCPRAGLNGVEKYISSEYHTTKTLGYQIGAGAAKDIWLANIHPLMQLHEMPKLLSDDVHPSSFYWKSESGGVYIRSFHLYPILINPSGKKVGRAKTIDASALADLKISHKDIYTEGSNKDFFCFEVTIESRRFSGAGPADQLSTYLNYFRSCDKSNYINLFYDITIGNIQEDEIKSLRAAANDFLLEITLNELGSLGSLGSQNVRFPILRRYFVMCAITIYNNRQLFPEFLIAILKSIYRWIDKTLFRVHRIVQK